MKQKRKARLEAGGAAGSMAEKAASDATDAAMGAAGNMAMGEEDAVLSAATNAAANALAESTTDAAASATVSVAADATAETAGTMAESTTDAAASATASIVESTAAEAAASAAADAAVDAATEGGQMHGLVPLRSAMDSDMEQIADMTEQFSQTMDPILSMYNAAMCATTARLEIIEDEFRYRRKRCPIHHIDTRLKSAKSIVGKLEKKDLDLTLSAACNNIYDIAGIRVVCSYVKDVYLIRDRLLAQDDIYLMDMKDYIGEPKANGYRSLHMIVRVPVYFMDKKQMVPVELQLRTLAMDLWASLEHDIKYKSLYQGNAIDFSDELKECSRLIYEAEEKMEVINRKLEG